MLDLISIGECLIELSSDKPLADSEIFKKSYAGDTLNVISMASTLGVSSGYITRVGEDPFAEYLISNWRNKSIDTTQVKLVPGYNSMHFISLLPDGNREFVYYRKNSAASTLCKEDIKEEFISKSKILHLSSICQAISESANECVINAAHIAKNNNVKVSFDTNLRLNLTSSEKALSNINRILPFVDIIFPSYPDESFNLLKLKSKKDVAQYFIDKGVKLVVLKCGDQGATIISKDSSFSVQSISPRGVVDTSGAGDAFVGGFLYGQINQMTDIESSKYGIASSGLKVGGYGALKSQPSKEEVLKQIDKIQITHH